MTENRLALRDEKAKDINVGDTLYVHNSDGEELAQINVTHLQLFSNQKVAAEGDTIRKGDK